jgi:DHA1 family multidrug resistance protein-like MFS transporter
LFVGVLAAAGTEHLGLLSGLAVSASAVAMMIGAPLWGRVADRVGQKETLMLCLFASGLLFLPQGLSQNVIHLIISRFAMGFFAAGISPALQSVIALHAPAERKAGVLGVSFSITLMGNALGPLLGGFLASALGFRWPFVLVAVILIASGFLSRSLPLKLEKTAYPPVPEMD